MPRSLLLSLVAAITLAACSKQEAETGAAPADSTAAPEANAPVDTAAMSRAITMVRAFISGILPVDSIGRGSELYASCPPASLQA